MGLDTVELLIAFEEKFGVSIPNEDATNLTTPRNVTEYLVTRITERGMSRDEVAASVRKVIEEQTGIVEFSDDDDFTNDMNLDRAWWR